MAFGAAAVPGAEDASSGGGEQVAKRIRDVENAWWKPREMIKNTGVFVHIYILVAVHPIRRFFPPPSRGLEDCHLKMVDSWGLYGSMLVGGCWLVTRVSIYGKTTLHPLVDPHIFPSEMEFCGWYLIFRQTQFNDVAMRNHGLYDTYIYINIIYIYMCVCLSINCLFTRWLWPSFWKLR